MAGTFDITETLCWMPAGWVYDNVLEGMASVLSADDAGLADRLLNLRTEINGGFLDLRADDAAILATLIQAADEAYQNFERRGAASFYNPSFYPGFREQFRQLREMLRKAQRERGNG
jgi:hypothetical protein